MTEVSASVCLRTGYCPETGKAICSPSNIASLSYLQSLDSAAFRLLQCCLGKLWHKTSRQNFKNSKIVQREL